MMALMDEVSARYIPTLVHPPHHANGPPNPAKPGTSQQQPHACEHLLMGWTTDASCLQQQQNKGQVNNHPMPASTCLWGGSWMLTTYNGNDD